MFEQSALTNRNFFDSVQDFSISPEDRNLLRELASQVADIAARPEQDRKKELWYRHNALEATKPLVLCDPENGWHEVIPSSSLSCKGDLARKWEFLLRMQIFWGNSMGDDKPIEAVFHVPLLFTETDWGLAVEKEGGADGGAFHFNSPLKDYATDLAKLRFPEITVDRPASDRLFELAQETFEGILEVGKKHVWWWSTCSTDVLAELRGMTEMMMDMYDYPDELHQLSRFLTDGFHHRLDFLEREGLLSLNNDITYIASGGIGYSRELPGPDFNPAKVTTMDMWGFSESQMTSEVAPDMVQEFILPYQIEILERFGLNCYGCCEGIDPRWDYVKKIPRLRRVSVSAWANPAKMAELLGKEYIYSRKMNPSHLAGSSIDEDYLRQSLREDMQLSRNCRTEYIMKDNHTIGNNPQNLIRWCALAQEEASRL
ncbi:hypothetical protein [Anaerotalea alkaliphila]|uniref:Uroporphyrinogen decarboxylase (URO-D) domain-containing protein n=1 Tax=Anaerotalea alkaliphila TaxID=2662126 RepID=A0A7X5HXV6_9FIRM|nr:hypothetical protein [Anaerotalea alkaliphila]NDL68664.1 hypothetical protein [Anaerotalea alkaliphila]